MDISIKAYFAGPKKPAFVQIYPLPLAYSLYACKKAENCGLYLSVIRGELFTHSQTKHEYTIAFGLYHILFAVYL